MIGSLTERVSVQTRSLTNNGGQPVEAWTTALSRVAASVETVGGNRTALRVERVLAAQLQAETSHLVTLPAPAGDVALSSRVLWHSRHGDRTLAIVGKALQQDARARLLTLACQEVRTA